MQGFAWLSWEEIGSTVERIYQSILRGLVLPRNITRYIRKSENITTNYITSAINIWFFLE